MEASAGRSNGRSVFNPYLLVIDLESLGGERASLLFSGGREGEDMTVTADAP